MIGLASGIKGRLSSRLFLLGTNVGNMVGNNAKLCNEIKYFGGPGGDAKNIEIIDVLLGTVRAKFLMWLFCWEQFCPHQPRGDAGRYISGGGNPCLLPPAIAHSARHAPTRPNDARAMETRASGPLWPKRKKAPPWTEAKAGQIARANRRKEPARGLEIHRRNIDPGPRQLFLQQGNLAAHPADHGLLLMAGFLGLVKLIPLPLDDFA